MVFWEGYVSDESMGLIAPIALYWLYGGIHMLMLRLKQYRLHSKEEEDEKNIVDMPTVIKGVLLQQFIQVVLSRLAILIVPRLRQSGQPQPPIFVQLLQLVIAMFVLDTWQYFVHRYLHTNTYLYRRFHSHHHRLIAPYAFGALYNVPSEGLVVVTLGGAIAFAVSGMTARTGVYFFSISALKSVDDHCGLWLPGRNILRIFFENNVAYHDIHHSLRGLKYNYGGPFTTFWDRVMGTYVPYEVVRREDGGLEAIPSKKLD